MNIDSLEGLSYPKDLPAINSALESRNKLWKFFAKVLVPGSYAFNTTDMDLMRIMIIDWSATNRTIKELLKQASDVFALDDDDLDKAIRGFGIDFVNQETLDSRTQRSLFLLALSDLYKIKGTPESITKALQFVGIPNTIIREHWIERDPYNFRDLRIRAVALQQYAQNFNSQTDLYEWVLPQDRFTDYFMSYDEFQNKLWEIGEPHWWYTKQEIIDIEYDSTVLIKLPSITPYFGIEYYIDVEKYNTLMGMLEKIMSDQVNTLFEGNWDLVPKEIGIDGFNQDLSKDRSGTLTEAQPPLSLVETYLAFSYCQIRHDEYVQYKELYDFLDSKGIDLSTQTYAYPWAYQELIYWAWINKDEQVGEFLTIDRILKLYPAYRTNYYCSTNELITWWVNREEGNTAETVPSVFFSTDYNFRYLSTPVNTTKDQIYKYNGHRNLNFKEPPLESDLIFQDAERLSNSDYILREPETDEYLKSYNPSNADETTQITYLETRDNLIMEYMIT